MRFATILLATSLAFAQTNRVLQFSQHQNRSDLQEASLIIRGVADIQQVASDDTTNTLSVTSSSEQAVMAGWLVQQLDRPPGPQPGVHECRSPVASDDAVRVFYATTAPSQPALQEIVTVVRSVADIRRIFVYNRLKAVVVRDTAAKVSVAGWMMEQMDQRVGAPAPEPHQYKLSDRDMARVFELVNPPSPEALQEIATLVRSVAGMQRLFIYNTRKALAMRGQPEFWRLRLGSSRNWTVP